MTTDLQLNNQLNIIQEEFLKAAKLFVTGCFSKGLKWGKPDELRSSRPGLRGSEAEMPWSTHPYIKIKGKWNYLYRAVDKEGDTIDFMLSKHRDEAAAKAFFTKA